jgi:hypothetical protein
MAGWNLLNRPANGMREPAVLTNKNQENFDNIHAENIVKRSGMHKHHCKKYIKILFSGRGASEKLKNLPRPSVGP